MANVEALLQDGRLRLAEDQALAPIIRDELLSFRANTLPSGRATFDAAGAAHDDLVLASLGLT